MKLLLAEGVTLEEYEEMESKGIFKIDSVERFKPLKEDYVWDEDKSIKWNKDKTEKHNEEGKEQYLRRKKECRKKELLKDKMLVQAFANEYNLYEERVDEAYSYAYREGHSGGMEEVKGILHDVLELYLEMSKF